MVGMFDGMEKKAREDLIKLFEDFIKDPDDKTLENRALGLSQSYEGVPVLSEEVANVGHKAVDIVLKKMTIKEAKRIIKILKK